MSTSKTERPNRQTVRLPDYDYGQTGAYFVTICTHGRVEYFGTIEADIMSLNTYGKIATEAWLSIPQHFPHVELDKYVVMPNHVHGIIVIQTQVNSLPALTPNPIPHAKAGSLPTIIQSYKSAVTRRIRAHNTSLPTTFWQGRYHEHIIRNDKALDAIRQYIHDNPLRWALDSENPSQNGST